MKKNTFGLNRTAEQLIVLLIAILILVGLFWVNMQFVESNPGGNDFLVHYVGTRSFLMDGISPYSDEVATRIQVAAYGHPAQGEEHELRVAYPLYSILLFAPFSVIGNYIVARALWMTVLEIALIGMTLLCFQLMDWKPKIWVQASILLFSVIWYHGVRGVVNGNAVILIALALTAIFLMIKNQNDAPAGMLLALTTIKPHLVLLIIIWLMVWSFYQKRWQLIIWFGATIAGLVLFGIVLIPDWITQNVLEILRYPGYNPAGTLAEALAEWLPGIATQLKWGIGTFFSGILLFEWWRTRSMKFDGFLWTAMVTLVVGQWIGIQTDPGNFILLFPALFLILSLISKKFPLKEPIISGVFLSLLFVGLWLIFVITIEKTYQPVQGSIMFIPVPALCLLGLYWVRYWSTVPQKLLWEDKA